MNITRKHLQAYIDALHALVDSEDALVQGGLIFEQESLSHHNADFIDGRCTRINVLIKSGRYW